MDLMRTRLDEFGERPDGNPGFAARLNDLCRRLDAFFIIAMQAQRIDAHLKASSAGAFHGAQVFINFDAAVGNFLCGGAPRYADARAGNNLLGHGRSHRSIAQHGQQ